jgi:DNA-binding SARP family transcriptional activator
MRHGDSGPVTRVASLVRARRLELGLTQQELAAKAGLSVAALRDIEQCRRQRPRPSSLAGLASALDLDTEQAASLASAAASPPPQQAAVTRITGPMEPGRGLWLSALGPLEAWRDGAPLSLGPPVRRAVLGLLMMDPDVLVRRDTMIDVLWREAPPRTAVGLVQAHVSRLRKTLEPRRHSVGGDGVLTAVGGAYRLQVSGAELDLLTFRDLAARAAAAWAMGDELTACELYEQAIGLWRGDPLADVDLLYSHPGITLLRQQLAEVLLRYAEVACALGQFGRVLPRLRALAAAEPLNESAHARLMIALAGSGQQVAAIRVYEDLRSRLDRELGIYPGEELAEAHLRVLRRDILIGNPWRDGAHRMAAAAVGHIVPRQLPVAPRYFTGRAREIDTLSGLLERVAGETDGMVIAALTGMAGIGKTALALSWAHQVADRFPDGQLFVNLRGFSPCEAPTAPAEALSGFLAALGVPFARIPVNTAGQAALFRSLLAGRRMLIVLDNARDAEQVRSLLPGSPGCMVLVTSRNRLTGLVAAEGAHLLSLDVLTLRESRDLLIKNLGAERALAEPAAVSELIAACDRLPLALCGVAARVAARPGQPLAALATETRDVRGRLDALETGEPATSVRMAFSWSRAGLRSESAQRMFRLLGMHPGPDITVPVAASLAGLSRSEAYLALTELCDGHMLTERPFGRYTCRDLLRAYAAEAACLRESEAERRAAVHRVLDHYLHTANTASAMLYPYYTPPPLRRPRVGVKPEDMADQGEAADWLANERHVLFAAIARAAEEGYAPHAWQLPWAAGQFFRGDAHRRKLIAAQESALTVAARLGDLAGQALAHCQLGLLWFWLGDHVSACHHLEEAIKLASGVDDDRFPTLAGLIRSYILQSQGRSFEARAQADESLQFFRAAGDSRGEVHALNAVSWHLEHLRYGVWTLVPGSAVSTGRREYLAQRARPSGVQAEFLRVAE